MREERYSLIVSTYFVVPTHNSSSAHCLSKTAQQNSTGMVSSGLFLLSHPSLHSVSSSVGSSSYPCTLYRSTPVIKICLLAAGLQLSAPLASRAPKVRTSSPQLCESILLTVLREPRAKCLSQQHPTPMAFSKGRLTLPFLPTSSRLVGSAPD